MSASCAKSISDEEKERIASDFHQFVKYAAYRLSWRVPPALETDDLIIAGFIGLFEALERYDGRVKLKTYVQYRIRGAMLDELRALDWAPRSAKPEPFLSLEELSERVSGENIFERIKDMNAKDPLKSLEEDSMRKEIIRIVWELTERERAVLVLYYWHDFTLKKIGEIIGVTESRVCQIHSQALKNLKKRLGWH